MSSITSIQLDTCVIYVYSVHTLTDIATYFREEWVIVRERVHLFMVVAGLADVQNRLNVRVDEPKDIMRR
jgi:hypothetical protein